MNAAIYDALGPWTAAACCRFEIRSLLRNPGQQAGHGKAAAGCTHSKQTHHPPRLPPPHAHERPGAGGVSGCDIFTFRLNSPTLPSAMTSDIRKILEATHSHPFLFVGSDFTHRYLGKDHWKGLVGHFAKQAKPEVEFAFEWYRIEVATAGSHGGQALPEITQRVEKDYARHFLADESFRDLRSRHETRIRDGVAANFRRSVRIYDWLEYGHKKHLKCRRVKKQHELLPTISEPGVFWGRLNPGACIRGTGTGRVRSFELCK
jgi:hypothetical protein